ncbi:DUF3892 domain-containing protein [Proteus sp. GOKU]|uniref:DUF3892 domain-containing protein n=1 Tax=Proteus TaxID=583 RepID=UPI001892C7F5|nr:MULTISPECIES: DUF3892 domain-containing protein [Proteus]QPB79513.1 DUF3892 domain-containing protein [Proteus sp. GOKU]QQP25520.1 DUF3892 domain-containing protein [Proteus vulgaris]
MTDFYIVAIKMDAENQHIDYVKTIQAGKADIDATINARQFIAELINENLASFQTAIQDKNGDWSYGATVRVIDSVYLTTEPNGTTRDNLDSLPKF